MSTGSVNGEESVQKAMSSERSGRDATRARSPVVRGTSADGRPRSANTFGIGGRSASAQEKQHSHISVAVRLRPLSEREQRRDDIPVWTIDDDNQICVARSGITVPKYAFDTVFAGHASNYDVYKGVCADVVDAAVNGYNGTVFAYGVTSSGKTHTMLGVSDQPGLVPQALRHLFKLVKKRPQRYYLVKISMLEIYNEIINDLLEPNGTNLRIRDDPDRGGIYVVGLKEVEVLSDNHALSLVAAGDAQRKVSATQFNDDSSRSHTLCRVSVESCDAESKTDRMISVLNLIDLAGSESARAAATRSHRLEGSYINKSLLTLGAVISKLSEGSAMHIPFRDSKLTRLLQSSLSGQGAKVAVICCITPAAAQAEETHNTLKFATRAKAVKITASRNNLNDERSQIAQYQKQIRELKAQLEKVLRDNSGKASGADDGAMQTMQDHVSKLKETLEKERTSLLNREQEKAALEARIERLTRIVLNSARAMITSQNAASTRCSVPSSPLSSMHRTGNAASRPLTRRSSFDSAYGGNMANLDALLTGGSTALDGTGSAGDIHPGHALTLYEYESPYVAENEMLKENLRLLMEEMEARGVDVPQPDMLAMPAPAPGMLNLNMLDDSMHARQRRPRADSHSSLDSRNFAELQASCSVLRNGAAQAHMAVAAAVQHASKPDALPIQDPTGFVDKIENMRSQVERMLEQLNAKDAELRSERRKHERFRELEQKIEMQLRAVTKENEELRADLSLRENQVNRLQGYGLDDLTAEDLSKLIAQLTQAVERVRISTQLRHLQHMSRRGKSSTPQSPSTPDHAAASSAPPSPSTAGAATVQSAQSSNGSAAPYQTATATAGLATGSSQSSAGGVMLSARRGADLRSSKDAGLTDMASGAGRMAMSRSQASPHRTGGQLLKGGYPQTDASLRSAHGRATSDGASFEAAATRRSSLLHLE